MCLFTCATRFRAPKTRFVKRFRFSRLNKSTVTKSDKEPARYTHNIRSGRASAEGCRFCLLFACFSLHRPFVSGGVCAACDPRVSSGKKPPQPAESSSSDTAPI